MTEDLNEQWRRLTEHYAQMLDGELLRLAGQYSDLTEVARQALREEMLKRGLGDPLKPEELKQRPGRFRFERGIELAGEDDSASDAEDGGPQYEYTWKTELCECENSEQANQIGEVLERAGIECWINDSTRRFASRALDLTNVRIMVAADQLEEARKIIAQPIPQDVIEDSKAEIPSYVAPKCPGCGDPDPTLLEDEQMNRWGCEVCGREWTELEKIPDEHA
jgi:hypothetical protein